MKFVIFHGSFGHVGDNWFLDIKRRLESLGQEVIVPQFPVDNWDEITQAGPEKIPPNQNLQNWLGVFEDVYKDFKKGEKLCFIGHSLGPLFILHAVDKYDLQLEGAIFVAPFLEKLGKSWQIDLVNKSFYKTNFGFGKLRKLIPVSQVFYSDDDPYVESNFSLEFAQNLGSRLILVKGGQHMNSEAGYTSFSQVFESCKQILRTVV